MKHARGIGLVVLLAAAGMAGFGLGRADCVHTFWPLSWSGLTGPPAP